MAQSVWEWIRDNNSWLLGLGSILVGLLGLVFIGNKIYQRAKRGSVAVSGGAAGAHIQALSAGAGSTTFQATQITVNQGITADEAMSIAQRTFEGNFARLSGQAAERPRAPPNLPGC